MSDLIWVDIRIEWGQSFDFLVNMAYQGFFPITFTSEYYNGYIILHVGYYADEDA